MHKSNGLPNASRVLAVCVTLLALVYLPAKPVVAGITTNAFPLGPPNGPCPTPGGIAAGQDGALWITESGLETNAIARVTTAGQVATYPMPQPLSVPDIIIAGPDGALWFAERGAKRIGRISTAGSISEYAVPSGNAQGLAVGPDGAVWFTERYTSKIGRITTVGVVTEFTLPFTMEPSPITAGPDGNLWFFDEHASAIVRFTTSGVATAFPVPRQDISNSIVFGSDGALWFTLTTQPTIGRMTTDGTFTSFPLAHGLYPASITAGPDGNLWFTEQTHAVARLTPAGTLTEYPLAQTPEVMTVGPDRNLWSVDDSCDPYIVRVIPNQGPSPSIGSAVVLDVPSPFTLTGTDPDDPPSTLRYAIVTGPSHGTITGFNSDGTLTYTGAVGYHGADSFTFTVSDGEKTSAPATLSLTVMLASPQIAAVNPSQVAGAGMPIQIIGDEFQAGAHVLIDSTPATNVVIVNRRTITAIAPEHGIGPTTVTVINPNGLAEASSTVLSYIYALPQSRGAGTASGAPVPPPSRPGPISTGNISPAPPPR